MPLTFPTEKTDQLSVDARTGLCNMVTPDLWRSAVVNSSNALPHSETNTQQKQTTAMLLKQLQRPS
jgi:hypothetical protein